MAFPKRLIIALSGASGPIVGIRLLERMKALPAWETHLVLSEGARRTILEETGYTVADVEALATVVHAQEDIGASIASGTFKVAGMVVAPCSMKTLAGVAHGFSENLILRAADVTLKERRRLVLVPREMPLSLIHLRNMTAATEAGAILLPPMLSFYQQPKTVDGLIDHVVGKILDLFEIEMPGFYRWQESNEGQ
jgi:polyprenyl P-hydroxybenzoate/phenylacrylic acid decarboxylase-like protein